MDLNTELYRFGVALAIGALVGMERQTRLEAEAREWDEQNANGGGPREEVSDEVSVRDLIAAGESTRLQLADASPGARAHAYPEAEQAEDGGVTNRFRRRTGWIPDFQQTIGVRTYALFSLAGALAAHVSQDGPWVFVAAILVLGALIVTSYLGSASSQGDLGLTSEVTAVVVFMLGGMCARGEEILAGAAAVIVTVILSMKQGLHRLARKIKPEDVNAVLKFALLTVVVLPILPKEPWQVGLKLPGAVEAIDAAWEASGAPPPPAPIGLLAAEATISPIPDNAPWWVKLTVSPRKIWYMVILISGISFLGYILGQILGTERGLMLTGIVGGLASSTAVSLSFAQKSKVRPELSPQFAIGILLANAIMPIRLLVVVAVIAPALIKPLTIPLLAMVAVAGITAAVLHAREKGDPENADVALKNPFELGPAFKFGLLFGVVLFVAEIAQGLFGNTGLVAVALLTGMTHVDAISLAVADMVSQGSQEATFAAILIAIAVISNTAVKGGFVMGGSSQLRRIAMVAFGLMFLAAAAGIVGLWLMMRAAA